MSNAEFVVADALRGYGIEAYLPTWKETVQWSDRQKVIERPLLPGYLFARCDTGPRREILRIAGVIHLLPNNLSPRPVPNEQIELVRRVLAAQLPVVPCSYVSGDEVLIDHGPLAGVKGIVQRVKNGTQVIVRIEMLQRSVAVTVPAADVLKAAT